MRGLMARIASGEQEEIDRRIDEFDRRNERPQKPNEFIPAWRRRMLGLEPGTPAGLPPKDLTGRDAA